MMYASIQMRGRSYGGYFFRKANISVQYADIPSAWRYANDPLFIHTFLTEELVGRTCDFPVVVQRATLKKELVAAGISITKKTARIISNNWTAIQPESFRRHVMKEFDEWWIDKGRGRFIDSTAEGLMINFRISELGLPEQSSAEIQLTPQAAEWLGLQLLKFARGQGDANTPSEEKFPQSKAHSAKSTKSLGSSLRIVGHDIAVGADSP